jgi:TRAP-type C4-dicarboxylate transport system permease small subunit
MRLLVSLLIAALFAWLVVDGWRTGTIRLRGGTTIKRRSRPWVYWTSLTLTALVAALVLAIGLGLIPPGHR